MTVICAVIVRWTCMHACKYATSIDTARMQVTQQFSSFPRKGSYHAHEPGTNMAFSLLHLSEIT